jgi:DNA-binding CsgD family transcriptional regulator
LRALVKNGTETKAAESLHISLNTLHTHMKELRRELNMCTTAQVLTWAALHGHIVDADLPGMSVEAVVVQKEE